MAVRETRTDTDNLFYDGLRDALGQVVRVVGIKRLAAELRPALSADKAAQWLRDCLDGGRREKLDLEEVQFILRRGREAGCHAAMRQLCRDGGYADPQPIEPEDERTAVLREFNERVRQLEQLARHLDAGGSRTYAAARPERMAQP